MSADTTDKAVFLDALGTLVRLEPPAPRLQAALARRGVEVSLEQAGRAVKAEIAYYRANLHRGRDADSLAALRADCAAAMTELLPPADDLLGALLEAIEFRPFDEVPEVLGELRSRGCKLIVVTNWDVSVHEMLARTGLAPLLDGAVSSAEVGAAKPDPAIFRVALELAGVEAAQAVHVGDTPAEDGEGARAAGIRAVLLDRERGDTLRALL